MFRLDVGQRELCVAISTTESSDREKHAVAFIQHMSETAAFEFAQDNELDAILFHSAPALLTNSGWEKSHRALEARLNEYMACLDQVAETFRLAGIPLVALKNGGIARGIYPCPGCCPMGDLDTLIEPRHFRRAHQLLLESGYTFAYRAAIEENSLEHAEQAGGAEYWKLLPSGEKLWLELQWRPVAGRWIRPDQEPPAEELLARSLPIPGTSARLLAPEDNLLQVCLHTAKHSYVRAPGFRLHLDVDRIVHYQPVDWQVFLQRVIQLQVKTAVYFSLVIPKEIFNTPIPQNVLDTLRPPAWKERLVLAWLNRVGLFNPNQPKFGRLGYILFTALLYDDLGGLLHSIFPDKVWMRRQYAVASDWLLPYYYLRRWFDLVFRRLKT